MILERIHTSVNEADHLTKTLDRTLFYRHVDHIMGHIPPAYSPCAINITGGINIIQYDDTEKQELDIRPLAARAAKCEVQLDLWVHIVACTKAHVQSKYPHWIVGVLVGR
jgi:hypothetical protein